jgi:hypothetical protein
MSSANRNEYSKLQHSRARFFTSMKPAAFAGSCGSNGGYW